MKLTDAEISSLLFDEQGSDPATPAAGFWRVYVKSDGLYLIDDAAVVSGPFGSAAALAAHLADAADAHDASAISADSTTLVGTGTDVQAVLEELDNGIADHLADATAAHAATAIAFTPAGTIAATTVQAAIEEVATEAGGGGAIRVEDEGSSIVAAATGINFAGAGVTVTDAGSNEALVTIPGSTGATWALKSLTTVRRTAGDINLQTATVAWANTSTALDLTAAAASGDRARVYVNALASNEAAAAFLDAVTLVSAAPVNSFANQGAVTSGPPFYGIPGWRMPSGAYTNIGGMAELVLVSGDISGGNVTIRFRSCTDANTTKTLFAGANYSLTVKLEIWTPV